MSLFMFKCYILFYSILLISIFQLFCFLRTKEKFEYTLDCENEILNTFLENVG